MDATPSFGVAMISEVPSNPQLTFKPYVMCKYSKFDIFPFLRLGYDFSNFKSDLVQNARYFRTKLLPVWLKSSVVCKIANLI